MMIHPAPRRPRPVVAILGGGVAGAATAFHLARAVRPDQVEIVVVEPRAALGGGLAYATDEPAHRINVPASKMTLIADAPGHFMDWLASARVQMSPGTLTPSGEFFPERRIFGDYVAAQLAPFLERGIVRHQRTSAVAVIGADARWRIDLGDGSSFVADVVVLAMTHPAPAVPHALRDLAGSPRLVADPYDGARISGLADRARLLVVGTGLTSADVVASLARRGYRGRITALSRHGLRSRGHSSGAGTSAADFATQPAETTVALLRRVRAAVAADAARGATWHATVDRVREQGQPIWAALPAAERRRLVRHLRTWWDVHRFRVAPPVEASLDRQLRLGRLAIVAARLVGARETADGIEVDFRPWGGDSVVSAGFDTVVLTTGPDHGAVLRSNPVFRRLAADGLVRADPLGLGLAVVDQCHPVGTGGARSDTLLVAGPLARGCVGELMGVPEVVRHAEHVAGILHRRIAATDGAVATTATEMPAGAQPPAPEGRTDMTTHGSITRRRFAAGAGLGLVASLAAPALLSRAVGAAEAKGLRIGWQKNGVLALARSQQALEKRFADRDLAITWSEFSSGPPLLEALGAGALDFGPTGDVPPLFAQAAGGNLLYVGTYAGSPAGSAILVHKDAPIQTLSDLKGKKIAFKRGSSAHNFTVKALRKGGLTPDDVEAADLAPPDALAAFRSGSIDAWTIWDPYFAVAQADPDARVLTTAEGILPAWSYFLANGRFTQANPDLVVDVLNELARVGKAAQADLDATVPALSKITGVPEAVTRVTLTRPGADLGRVGPVSREAQAYQQALADEFHALGILPKRLTINDIVWQPKAS